jgi:peptidyl-prolyl cis-trans isomerase C
MRLTLSRLLISLFISTSLPVLAQNVAVVNGKAIPSNRADILMKQLEQQGQKDSPELRKAVREELINREILTQAADKQGLGNTAEIKNQLEMNRQMFAISNLFADYLKKNQPKEEEIKAEYDSFKAQTSDKEYRARHILVDKEEDAKAIIEKLKAGEKFEELAKRSKDTASATNGGELNWAVPNMYVQPFAEALMALKKDAITDTPVKTQYGYHVIQLQDIRPTVFPNIDNVRPRIIEVLNQKKLTEFQKELRKKAKVE